MKQCEPLKEPLVRSSRRMPMGHVGIVTSDPIEGAAGVIAVDTRTQELPKVFILREQYDRLSPDFIREKQEEAHCILVPVEQDELDRLRQESIVYTNVPEMPKVPEILWKEPSPYFGGANIDKGYKHIGGRQKPKDYAKKKKAKRRMQKQSRKKKR